MVAEQAFPFFYMQGQGIVTVWAAQDVSTVAAKNISSRAASIQKQDRLFTALQSRLQLLEEVSAKDPALTCFEFTAHVHDFDRRQSDLEDTPRQFEARQRPHPTLRVFLSCQKR